MYFDCNLLQICLISVISRILIFSNSVKSSGFRIQILKSETNTRLTDIRSNLSAAEIPENCCHVGRPSFDWHVCFSFAQFADNLCTYFPR